MRNLLLSIVFCASCAFPQVISDGGERIWQFSGLCAVVFDADRQRGVTEWAACRIEDTPEPGFAENFRLWLHPAPPMLGASRLPRHLRSLGPGEDWVTVQAPGDEYLGAMTIEMPGTLIRFFPTLPKITRLLLEAPSRPDRRWQKYAVRQVAGTVDPSIHTVASVWEIHITER